MLHQRAIDLNLYPEPGAARSLTSLPRLAAVVDTPGRA
jgi:hypothetical protein